MKTAKEAIEFLDCHIERGLLQQYGDGKKFDDAMNILRKAAGLYDPTLVQEVTEDVDLHGVIGPITSDSCFCPCCGKEVVKGQEYCDRCGQHLTYPEDK